MKVSVQLDDNIIQNIEKLIQSKLDEIMEKVVEENIDEIIFNAVKTQIKSCAIIYMQSPEFRNKLLQKVKPKLDAFINKEE